MVFQKQCKVKQRQTKKPSFERQCRQLGNNGEEKQSRTKQTEA
jgi:hypothetical protein